MSIYEYYFELSEKSSAKVIAKISTQSWIAKRATSGACPLSEFCSSILREAS